MRKLKEILRLRFEAHLSYRQIAGSLHLSYGVVAKYSKLAAAAGLTSLDISALDEAALARLLGQAADVPPRAASGGKLSEEAMAAAGRELHGQ